MAYDYSNSASYLEANRVELIEAANRGMGGRGAVVEAMFRLADTIKEQETATKRLNVLLLWFTIVIALGTVALLLLGIVQLRHEFRPTPPVRFEHLGTTSIGTYVMFDHQTAQACWAGPAGPYTIASPDGKNEQKTNGADIPFCKDLK